MSDAVVLSLQETISMQLEEMDLVEAAYPEVMFDTPDPRHLLREALEGTGLADTAHADGRNSSTPLISFRCPLSAEATLRIRLPRRYPETPLLATVDGTPHLSAATRARILAAAHEEAQRLSSEQRNEPQCLAVLGEAMLAASDPGVNNPGDMEGKSISGALSSKQSEEENGATIGSGTVGRADASQNADAAHAEYGRRKESSGAKAGKGKSSPPPLQKEGKGHLLYFGRRLIYSHHIIAPQKRAGILKTARELELGGFSKVGWPGVIIVEGEESACEEFVKTLRTWRWKHLAVRGEEVSQIAEGQTIDQHRVLPRLMEELGEKEGVSALAQRCKAAGLDDLFATLIR